jgi:aminoglycoside/choline kinase family phosphotransferase
MTWDPIADTPEALTPEWLTSALRTGGRIQSAVTAVQQETVGTGQMCDCLRLTLTYGVADSGPPTMIAKLPAADPTSRATALALRSYENEVRFYQQLAPGLPIRTPEVYYADIEVTTARFVLLLEDMTPARQGDQLQGCTADMAGVALDELVRLHAPRWADPSLAAMEWLHRDREAQQQFLMMLLPSLWDGFRQRYTTELGHDVHVAGDALFARLGQYLSADSEPWTVVHGDYRLDNLLFDATPGGVPLTVVDWQTCGHGPALNDVAYFIGAGLLPDVRSAVEEDLVREYHGGLLAAGVEHYDWDRCWRDYRRGTWAGLIMAVAASMLVERTPRGDEMFLTMAARHSRHALDLDATALLTV